jgi:hypothetical protein
MARLPRLALIIGGALLATPAAAQLPFPNRFDIFNPPRPPADVPNRPPQEPQPPSGRLPPGPPPDVQGRLPPGPPPGRIQSQPLPPPPGVAVAPPDTRPSDTPAAPPPGQRPQRGTPPPASTAVQPGDEVIVEPPAQKIANPTAVFSGLDKITGRIISFEVAINETVRFGALEVTPRVCYTRPPTENANTDGFIEVDELTLQGELRRIFTGWMFVASPGLNAVEHPIYDVWLTDCKGATQPAVAETQPEQQPAPPPSRTQRQQPQRRTATPQPGAPPQQLPPPPAR